MKSTFIIGVGERRHVPPAWKLSGQIWNISGKFENIQANLKMRPH